MKLIIGMKFNRWTILYFDDFNPSYCYCRCDCGTERMVYKYSLSTGNSKSCGCHSREVAKILHTKHGCIYTEPFQAYRHMIRRCYDNKDKDYKNYGGRGISVCAEWLNNPKSFVDWCYENGYKKGLEIDRRINSGNYEPDNCRLVTSLVNNRNKRTNLMITYNGETKCLSEWCDVLSLNVKRVRNRIKNLKWTVEDAFNN